MLTSYHILDLRTRRSLIIESSLALTGNHTSFLVHILSHAASVIFLRCVECRIRHGAIAHD